jgi:hypothetical protein
MTVRGARSKGAEHARLDATWDSRASRTEWGYYRFHRCGLARMDAELRRGVLIAVTVM